MRNFVTSCTNENTLISAEKMAENEKRVCITFGDLSVYIDTDRLSELIFKLKACLPEPETEKI